MRILGISGATKIISIGLVEENRVLAETTLADIQSEKIMFYVNEAGIKPEQLDGIAATVGPGSYSGLRGGLAAAKSLAQTLNLPIAGISTLEAIAYNLIDIEGTMAVILDARWDEYNFALFGAAKGKLQRLTDDLVIKADKLAEKLGKISGTIRLAGNISFLREKLSGNNYLFAEELNSQPYGINVARLGLERIKAGKTDDLLKLAPQYSHQPNIREFS